MSKSTNPLAQFSRDPVLRNALKLSAADAGSSFTVDEAITPELVAAYRKEVALPRMFLAPRRGAGTAPPDEDASHG